MPYKDLPVIAGADDTEGGTQPGAEPAEGAPPATADATPPAASPAPASDGPWAKDLAENFEDPATRAAVDEFLRTTVQPHVTKLEQATAPNRDAEKLWNDFRESPVETYLAVSGELFGEDVATNIVNVLKDIDENPAEPNTPEAAAQQEQIDQLPPEVREVVEAHQESKRLENYNSEFDRLKEEHKDDEDAVEVIQDLFHPFVAAADGDFDIAYAGYQEWAKEAKSKFGIQVPESLEDGTNTPPPTINSEARSGTEPPTIKKGQSLDEAIDDFLAERKSPPPTVGSV